MVYMVVFGIFMNIPLYCYTTLGLSDEVMVSSVLNLGFLAVFVNTFVGLDFGFYFEDPDKMTEPKGIQVLDLICSWLWTLGAAVLLYVVRFAISAKETGMTFITAFTFILVCLSLANLY
jgi:hypothetical protein